MTPYYADDWLTLLGGDCRDVLPQLEADSVDCVVTSPPYWGLRDYGTASWVDGDEDCDHIDPGLSNPIIGSRSTLHGGIGPILAAQTAGQRAARQLACRKGCGATRVDAQLGLESTPDEYVAAMVDVFRAVWRVLRPGGTCWLNLGDSYAGDKSGGRNDTERKYRGEAVELLRAGPRLPLVSGLKSKDMVGIPWRVAFALQADGWYLRSDVIWSKPNVMPESVTDRPTKAHEYVFLLTKSERYYYDADAIAEPAGDHPSGQLERGENHQNGRSSFGTGVPWVPRESKPRGSFAGKHGDDAFRAVTSTRNARTVWSIATRPYAGAHFAVFPPELPTRCILAGSPELGVVLDPFAGSGTVGMVANRLSRRAILVDLNPAYLQQQLRRNSQQPLGLVAP